jgi:hypothetical protein
MANRTPARDGPGAVGVGEVLRACISDRVMELQGARDLLRMADGFVRPSGFSYGSELTLQLDHDDFARILGQSRKAVLELRGEGIGHVDGQTGRERGATDKIISSLNF